MDSQLRELLPFLRDKNPQVRHLALENLLPQTPKDAPYRSIFLAGLQSTGLQKPKESDVVRDLKLLCRDQLAVAHDAFRALVNLSDSPLLVASLSEPSFLNFVVSYIVHPQATLADLASMLLSNLTASSTACAALIAMEIDIIMLDEKGSVYPTQSRCGTCAAPVPYPSKEAQKLPALPFLVDAFVEGAFVGDDDLSKRPRKAELHFLGSVFANLASSPAGNSFLLRPSRSAARPSDPLEYPLAKLVSFTEHNDRIRRAGVLATIKNCSFDSTSHTAMLTPDDENVPNTESKGIGLLPYILLPLAGPEEFDLEDQEKLPEALQFLPPTKKREPEANLRLTIVETLLLLCHTRMGRDYQRSHGVYEIVRAAHIEEKDDKVSEHIERLVNLLKREEGSDVKDDNKASEQMAEDESDEDGRIEEV